MNRKSVFAHAILALGGLTLAYLVWTDDSPAVDENEATIFECDPDTLSAAELTLDAHVYRLEVERDGDAQTIWITTTREPEEGPAVTTRFVGNEAAETYLAQIAPLRARRSLGTLDDAQRTELGFDEPDGTLTLTCGERTAAFTLGDRAFGEGDRYVSASGGAVYLVTSDRMQPLQSATAQLMQRQLHTFEWSEVEAMTLRGFGVDKRLQQRNRLDERSAEWVDAANPTQRNELYGNWFSRYPRMRVQAYLEEDAHPGADLEGMSAPSEPILRAQMFDAEGQSLGELELVRVSADPPAFYARTETTRGWVRLPTSVAQAFTEDLRPVLGLEPEEPPAEDQGATDEPAGGTTETGSSDVDPTEAGARAAGSTGSGSAGGRSTGASAAPAVDAAGSSASDPSGAGRVADEAPGEGAVGAP